MRKLWSLFNSLFTPAPPVIKSGYGYTTEWARKQAAMNMRSDPQVKARVEQHLVEDLGSEQAGMAESRRRYPEAYD